MKRLNLNFKSVILISAIFIFSTDVYSQWKIAGSLSGLEGRPAVSVVNKSTAWVTGGSVVNATYRTTNGGASWLSTNTTGITPFLCIWAVDEKTLFAGDDGVNGVTHFYKTTDGGMHWAVIDSIESFSGFRSIKFSISQPGFGIALGGSQFVNFYEVNFLYKTFDGGNNWTKYYFPVYTGYGIAISGLNVIDSKFYALGTTTGSSSIIKTTNGGETYDLSNLNLPAIGGNFVRGVAFKENKLTGIAGSTALPLISRTTNGGLSWVNIDLGITPTTTSTVMRWIEGTNICFMTLNNTSGGILRSINGGLNWTPMTTEGQGIFNFDIKAVGSDIFGYAVSTGFTKILRLESKKLYSNNSLDKENMTGEEVNKISSQSPVEYKLHQNYPNPFNPATNVEFGISKQGFVSLKVYDVHGKEVATIVNSILSPGTYKYDFDGSNLSSGNYFYRLESNGFMETKSMILLK